MGGTQWVSDPYKFSLDELADIGINEQKEQRRGCCPKAVGSFYPQCYNAGFGFPDNGEFTEGDWGDGCSMCAWQHGKECNAGGLGGGYPKVKRVAYKGDQKKCCFANANIAGSVKTVDGLTCDPLYRNPNSAQCITEFEKHCKTGKYSCNIGNDKKGEVEVWWGFEKGAGDWACNEWVPACGKNCTSTPVVTTDSVCTGLKNTSSSTYNKMMKNFCNASNENAISADCQTWCATNIDDCTILNKLNRCEKLGLSGADCNDNNISALQNKCKKYAILSEQGLVKGYPCTPLGVSQFETDCAKHGINIDSCTPEQIEIAKSNVLQEDIKKAQLNKYDEIKDVVKNIAYDVPTSNNVTTNTPNNTPSTSYIWIIILIICLVILLSMSSSASYLLLQDS